MTALLRQFRHIWQGSKLLGPSLQSLQDAPCFAVSQAAPFSTAKVYRARKKATEQEAATDGAELGDGHSTPSKPKRSPSAYTQYFKEQFAELKKTSSKLTVSEGSKVIGNKWKNLSDEDKQPYLSTAVAAKLANPVRANPPKTKAPTKTNGYRLFIKENFEAVKARNAALGAREVMTAMGHEWKAKPQAEKDSFIAKADEYNRTLSSS